MIVECQAKLKPLLRTIAGAEKVLARGEPLPPFDVHARLMTMPCIFGTTPDSVPGNVPYLAVDEKRVERMRERLDAACDELSRVETRGQGEGKTRGGADCRLPITGCRMEDELTRPSQSQIGNCKSQILSTQHPPPSPRHALRVGITWQGNPGHKGDRFRSIPLSAFGPLAKVDGVQLISLQKGHGSAQIAEWRDENRDAASYKLAASRLISLVEWMDPSDLSTDALLDTAAMLKTLDLVICCDTSIGHLAGALGVDVWMALPISPDWRWLLERDDTPWYPTMRLFRQKRAGEWGAVIERMAEALREPVEGAQERASLAPKQIIAEQPEDVASMVAAAAGAL